MPSLFDTLTLPQLTTVLRSAPDDAHRLPPAGGQQVTDQLRVAPLDAGADLNRTFYEGDHWQDGRAWQGPTPPATDAEAATIISEIRRAFVSKNAIREVVGRHVAGVVGREPAWGFTPKRPIKTGKAPTRAEQTLIEEAEAALTAWWDERGGLGLLQEAAATLLLSGRASVRLYVPPGLLADGAVPPGDLAAQLERIFVHHPQPAHAAVLVDVTTQQRCGVYRYREGEEERAELSYVDMATGETVLAILSASGRTEMRLPLDRALLLGEAVRPALVSEQVRSEQMQLNMAKTMEGRNAVQGGFLERIVLGGQMPGEYVDDPTAPADAQGRRRRFVPGKMRLGAGRTNWIAGLPIRDASGNVTGYTTPSVSYRDPVAPDTFQATARGAYVAILEEVSQLHAAIAGDATASGVSRQQARADFEKSLGQTKAQIDKLARWLLEAALSLASYFAGQPARFSALRAVVDCRIDTGPLAADERTALLTQWEKGALSLETLLALLGVEDVDAELTRIAEEQAERMATAQAISDPAAPGTPASPATPDPTSGDPSPGGGSGSSNPSGGTDPNGNPQP